MPTSIPTRPGRLARSGLATAALLGAGVSAAAGALTPEPAHAPSAGNAFVRVNQVGYLPNEEKRAVLMASDSEDDASFHLVQSDTGDDVYSGAVEALGAAWNRRFAYTFVLDFSSVTAPGTYYLRVDGPAPARSPVFRIASGQELFAPLLSHALFFYQAQRDGADVDRSILDRQPSHLDDRTATVYRAPSFDKEELDGSLEEVGGPVDVSGGWSDAGDYLKFVETASYTDGIMLMAARDHSDLCSTPRLDFAAEGRRGLDWLLKMWDNDTRTLYYQVGIGDGDDSVTGDHDVWRLPQVDDVLEAKDGDPNYYLKHRPVLRAGRPGSPASPNLAGRLAADFAMGFQLFHQSDPVYAARCLSAAETVFDLARTQHVDRLLTTAPYSYYPETQWRDDMEWGAAELYRAVALGDLPPGLPHPDPNYYLNAAAHWAHQYIRSSRQERDTLNLYDVSGLAHYELCRDLRQSGDPGDLEVTQKDLLRDLARQLSSGARKAASDPFGLGVAYAGPDASPHALGLAVEAWMYEDLTGEQTFHLLLEEERDWTLGCNAWGTSFIVGAGEVFPHTLHHQVANLSGSLDGSPPILFGAVVDGPAAEAQCDNLSADSDMRTPPDHPDPFDAFTGRGARYEDSVAAWPCVEPADDYTALSVLMFAENATGTG